LEQWLGYGPDNTDIVVPIVGRYIRYFSPLKRPEQLQAHITECLMETGALFRRVKWSGCEDYRSPRPLSIEI